VKRKVMYGKNIEHHDALGVLKQVKKGSCRDGVTDIP